MNTKQQLAQEKVIQLKNTKERTFECVVCAVPFATTSKKPAKCCSEKCRAVLRLNKKNVGTLGTDFVECPLCKVRLKQINNVHARMHGYATPKDMAVALGINSLHAESTKQFGNNNPAAGHNGKYSKWSKNFIHGYSEVENKKFAANQSARRQDPSQKHKYKSNIEYWVDKNDGDIEKAKQDYSKFQTRDLAFFVEKYGEEEGKERHKSKIEKWSTSLSNKTDEEKASINKRKLSNGYSISKAEKAIFSSIGELFPKLETQYQLLSPTRSYLYDFRLGNKIIEYFGDFWHHNPSKYGPNWVNPISKLSSLEKQAHDQARIDTAKQQGYEVLVIWESQYNQNPQKVINECIQFLMK